MTHVTLPPGRVALPSVSPEYPESRRYRPAMVEPVPDPSAASAAAKNRQYDTVGDEVWRIAVYEPVHHGWEFTNAGGAPVLDALAFACQVEPGSAVLELCSGTGAVARYLHLRHG